jgi:hypothetical protein
VSEWLIGPVGTSVPCQAHRYHSPKPLYSEIHHVVPRAWQATWVPEGAHGLWAPQTIALCPTGHRNVHRVIHALMEAGVGSDDPQVAHDGYRDHGGPRVGVKEWVIAFDALLAFRRAGGSLELLRAAGQFGQI